MWVTVLACTSSAFYRDPDGALDSLWTVLRERGIQPNGVSPQPQATEQTATIPAVPGNPVDEDDDNLTALDATSETSEAESVEIQDTGDADLLLTIDGNGDSAANMAAYKQWVMHPVPDPHSASLQELMEGLIEIVAAEGPVICRRVYLLYNRAAGNGRLVSQILHLMNRAIYRAVKLGRLQQNDEQKKGGQSSQIVRLSGTPEVVVRQRGLRSLEEIPPLEIKAFRDSLLNGDSIPDDDSLIRKMASAYGVGRVTTQTRKLLLG